MGPRLFLVLLLVVPLPLAPPPARAADLARPPSPADFVRFAYHYELLEEALARSVATHGPYVVAPFGAAQLTTARVLQEAVRGELINLLALDVGNEIANAQMIPVPIPLDRGLLGYRVSLIVRDSQERLAAVEGLPALRRFSVGRGSGWGDVRIFEHNGFPVVTAPQYHSLFEMLARGRFDLFPRGVTEAPQELAAFGDRFPELAIEERLLLHYPYAQFFYVSRQAPRLAARLEAGLEAMLADGSFLALFERHFAAPLAELRLAERRLIELENPFLPAWVPFHRTELWYDPRAGAGGAEEERDLGRDQASGWPLILEPPDQGEEARMSAERVDVAVALHP